MGTFSVEEDEQGREYSIQSPGVESTLTTIYNVLWTPASSADPYPGDAAFLTAAGLPQTRSRPPVAIYGSDPWLKRLVCRSHDPKQDAENQFLWRIRVTFGTFAMVGDWEFCTGTRHSLTRSHAIWRLAPTFPADGTVAWPATTDIAGTKVDLNGVPRPYEIVQQELVLELFWDRTVGGEPPWSTWLSFVNKRNDATFLGGVKGTWLYQGYAQSPYYEWYRIQHRFLWDAWYHLEQVPVPIPTGAPLCTSGVTVLGLVILQADKVGFLQRYPDYATFSGIIPAGALAEFTTPIPVAI